MTRAKKRLMIHCNTDIFNRYSCPGLSHKNDPTEYKDPEELLIQLTHKDVYLDFFKTRQDIIPRLRSGMSLELRDNYLVHVTNNRSYPVASFSKAFREKLIRWASQGYYPADVIIQFIVSWKGEADTEDTFIILPTIKLKKNHENDSPSMRTIPSVRTISPSK